MQEQLPSRKVVRNAGLLKRICKIGYYVGYYYS